MNDLGEEGGVDFMECSLVQLNVLFVCRVVYSESSFFEKAIQLHALFLQLVGI